ncbi:hypothetical protein HK097_009860, partial [Rhizophlyctis rosea]
MQAVPGEQVIRGLAAHVRTHHATILSASKAAAEQLDDLTARAGRPLPGIGLDDDAKQHSSSYLPSFLSFGFGKTDAPSITVSSDSSTSSHASSLSPFTLDPQQLAYLLRLFGSSDSVQAYVKRRDEGADVNADDPFMLTNQSTANGYGLSFLWGGKQSAPSLVPPLDEDILLLYRFLEKLPILRLAPVAQNSITEMSGIPSPPSLTLSTCLHNLVSLELLSTHPFVIEDWNEVRSALVSIVCQESLSDVTEIIEAVQKAVPVDDEDDDIPALLPTVTHLSLPRNTLLSFPETFTAHVPSLIHLDLSHNNFTSVPVSLSSLSQLQTLNLTNNKITTLAGAEDRIRNVTILSLRGNAVESLLGVETLAALRVLDVRDNKLWDVFEVGRLAALVDIGDIRVEGNPLVKLELYRINIFTYFKERAFNLLLDNSPPNPAEQRAIRSNLTVASAPKKPSVPTAHPSHSGATSSSAADETDRQSMLSVSVTGRSVRSGGKTRKKGEKGKKSRKAGSELNQAVKEEDETEANSRTPSLKEDGARLLGSLETVETGEGEVSRDMSRDSLTETGVGANSGSKDVTPRVSVVSQASGAATSPPRVRRFTQIEAATGDRTGGEDSDLLVSRMGRKGTRVTDGKKPKKETKVTGKIREGEDDDTPLSRPHSEVDSSSILATSPHSITAGDGYRRKIEAMQRESGGDWMKVYLEMQEQERKVKEAEAEKRRAEAEEARRKKEEHEEEERRVVEEAKRLEEQIRKVASGESLPVEKDVAEVVSGVERPDDVSTVVGTPVSTAPSGSGAGAGKAPNRLPAPPNVSHIASIGPYRRIYDYNFRGASSSSGMSSRIRAKSPQNASLGDLRVGEAGLGGTKGKVAFASQELDKGKEPGAARPTAPMRRTSSGPDVEIGTSKDFMGVSPNRKPTGTVGIGIRPLPPLVVTPGSPPPHPSTVPTTGTPPLILS